MSTILRHTLSEIKPQKTKLFNPVSTMQRLNRQLAEAIDYNGDDAYMANYLVDLYLRSLDLYHVSGRAGSLLPKEEEAPEPQPTAAQVIAAANAAYDAYAQHVPFGCGGSLEAAAIGHQVFQAALAGGAA